MFEKLFLLAVTFSLKIIGIEDGGKFNLKTANIARKGGKSPPPIIYRTLQLGNMLPHKFPVRKEGGGEGAYIKGHSDEPLLYRADKNNPLCNGTEAERVK